ncbi:MAG: hypothetical protein PW786_14665 [Arachidicoccus sp.]|nr:hypothetical protein [Arachidicoccus sp.]
MARNIHDETGPALLYAKTLAKSSRNGFEKSELEQHIEHTMEKIRSLSHELKSNKQYTLNNLVKDLEITLKKLNYGDAFSYTIYKNIDEKHFLSHYQYSQLKAILNECITNTIRHAIFDKISIALVCKNNKLIVSYEDNGKGWQEDKSNIGIGMKNMEERISQLNGDWILHNNYPNGY